MTPDDHNPTPPAAAPTLPPEVQEAIYAAAKKINLRLNTTHYVNIAGIIRDELAPLWPRPAKVTADARELAERIRDAIFHGASHWDAETNRIAAVLAPVLADRDIFIDSANRWKARAEAAEKEASEVSHVAAQALARAEAAERELARWIEQLSLETNAGPTGDLMATSRAWQAVRRERDDLRAQVARMNRRVHHGEHTDDCPFCLSKTSGPGGSDPMCQLCKLESERDDLRSQLAAAREDRERLDWLITQGPESAGIGLNGKAWDAAIDLNKDTDHEAIRAAIDQARQEGARHD